MKKRQKAQIVLEILEVATLSPQKYTFQNFPQGFYRFFLPVKGYFMEKSLVFFNMSESW